MRRTRLARVAAAAAALAASLGALTAPAHAATNLNSCRYSYDSLWRDMTITLDGTAGVAAAAAGDVVVLNGVTATAALPDWMARYGYNFGFLHAGPNEIPVTIWIALAASNTAERVQVHEVETVAETTIEVSGGEFQSATPFRYDVPQLPTTQWTARGGPIEFAQAGSGTLPQLPVGPGGRMQKPRGSIFIQATLGEATLGLDCVAGSSLPGGDDRQEQTPEPLATVAVPAFDCIAPVPAASVSVDLVRRRDLPPAVPGVAYGFAPSVGYRLPASYLSSLYTAGLLVEGDNAVTGTATAVVDAGGGRQLPSGPVEPVTVRVTGGGVAGDVVGVAHLAPGTWMPGTAGLGFAAAAPGALGALTVDGFVARPYGSVYVRLGLGSPARRLSLDCVSGQVAVVNATPYSELGDQPGGDQGRYAITPNALDAFAIAHPAPELPPTATPTAMPVPTVAPIVTPVPTPTVAGAVSVRSSKLKLSGKRVSVSLACIGGSRCAGTLSLRTASKAKLGKRAKRVVTLTKRLKYSLAAGGRATVRLTLGADGRALLKARRKVSVRLRAQPSSGASTSKALTLSR